MNNPNQYVLIFDWWDSYLFDRHLPYVRVFFNALRTIVCTADVSEEHIIHIANLEVRNGCKYASQCFVNNLVRALTRYYQECHKSLNLPDCFALTARYSIIGRNVVLTITDHFVDLRGTYT